MKRQLWGLASALLLLAAAAGRLPAQELSEEDIFDTETFDTAVAESQAAEQKERLQYLVGGVFLASSTVGAPAAFDGYSASGSFTGKAFTRLTVPSYGSLYLGYNFSHTLFQGEAGSLAGSLPPADLYDPTFALSEFYLGFDAAKTVFFRVGSQLVAWGPSAIWTPVDFFNLERLNPLASVDLRVGKPALRLHVPFGKGNLFLVTDLSQTVSGGVVGDLAETVRQAVRLDLTAWGAEFGLSGYFGYDLPASFGFDLSGRLLGFDVYGEAALTVDFPAESVEYALSAGLQRTFGELKDWTVQAEGFYQSRGQPDESGYPALIGSGDFVPLYVGRWYAYAGLTKQNLFVDFLDATLSGFLNVSDLSYYLRLAATFDLPRFLKFTASLAYSGGGEGKEFTWFTSGDALSGTLQVRFEF